MRLLKQALHYLSPFKGNILLILLFNILYAFFSLFSLTLIVPFLSVLFGEAQMVITKPDLAFTADAVINTFYYYMGQIITLYGVKYALFYIAGTMVLFSFLSNLFRYLSLYCLAPIRTGVLRDFRNDIYKKLVHLPFSFYFGFKKGDIMNRMGSDVQEVEYSIVSSLQTYCRDPFLLIVYVGTLVAINLKLTLITLLILVIAGYLIAAIGKQIKRYSVKAQTILAQLTVRIEEAISGLRVIKGYNAIDQASADFEKENKNFTQLNTKIFRISELGSPLSEFLSILSLILILLIGTSFIFEDPVFKGEIFVLYILVFARMIQPAKQLVSAHYAVQKGMASSARINQILDSDEQIKEINNPISIQTMQDGIEYQDVFYSYLENQEDVVLENTSTDVLKNINLKIEKGEVVALTGPSGSGKSTMIDLLPRFYDIKRGKITIDGTDIKDLKLFDLRELFGVVNQDVILFHDTIYNNIAFGRKDVTEEMVINAAKVAQAHSFIMEMEDGYQTIIGDRGMKLSGGQRQRLSIARVVLKDPQVVILDEATSALDTESEYLVQQAMDTLIKGRTAIIIAHRLSTIRNANRIVFIENGKIKEEGTHEELMLKKGNYCQFCAVQGGT